MLNQGGFHGEKNARKMCEIMAEKKDVPMNAFPEVTDAAYIYAEGANLNQVKIKKSNLLDLTFLDRGIFEGDLNELRTAGMYYVTGNTINKPEGYSGLALVFKSSIGVVQIAYNIFNGSSAKRVLLFNNGNLDTWSNWG